MMEQTTGETSINSKLEAPAVEKAQKSLRSLLLSTYKIPFLSLVLFAVFALRALHPEALSFGSRRHKSYQFKNTGMVFFASNANFFMHDSYEEAEEDMVKLFPSRMQKKVKRVIRPVLVLCEKYQLDPFWVLSVMWTESSFKHESTSKKGARGLMQLMPPTYLETLAEMKRKGIFLEADRGEDYLRYQYGQVVYDLGYPKLVSKLRNLEVGIFYLKNLFEDFDSNHYYATVSYNMGPNWTKTKLKNNQPVVENNRYLNKVLRNYFQITRTLAQAPNVTFIPRI
jgi:hypothetical protein